MAGMTVHMVANSHIDPVWLWRKTSGSDEAVATCRTACDLLEEYPELIFTMGEAWIYEQLKKFDPDTLNRIRGLAEKKQWIFVGGSWVQPDCNFPSAPAFLEQYRLGLRYFKENFGVTVSTAYNIDSFGHGAFLPGLFNSCGIDFYVFMRPQEHEKELPSNLFRWRSADGGEVLAFRIPKSYLTSPKTPLKENIEAAVGAVDPAARHTMCFYGVGDHGGGPVRKEIEWIREHLDYGDGVTLQFSDPVSFFAAVREKRDQLPVIHEELQYHAVGCYSTYHSFKQTFRRVEFLAQAAGLLSDKKETTEREHARRVLLFNQFHDIAGGCSVKSAYDDAFGQLGYVREICTAALEDSAGRKTAALPPSERQRILLYNTAPENFSGYVEIEPWTGFRWMNDKTDYRFLDRSGKPVPVQVIRQEAAAGAMTRYLLSAAIPAGGTGVLEMEAAAEKYAPPQEAEEASTADNGVLKAAFGLQGIAFTEGVPEISVQVFSDPSDTWSHGIHSYPADPEGVFEAEGPWLRIEDGPIRSGYFNTLRFGNSVLQWHIYLYRDEPVLTMKIRLNFSGSRRIIKLVIPGSGNSTERRDGVPGGIIPRNLDGREYPVYGHVSVTGENGAGTAAVSWDTFAGDVQKDGTIRMTMLRTPIYAHHPPFDEKTAPLFPVMDQGEHEYEISVLFGDSLDGIIGRERTRLKNPVIARESTLGMGVRHEY